MAIACHSRSAFSVAENHGFSNSSDVIKLIGTLADDVNVVTPSDLTEEFTDSLLTVVGLYGSQMKNDFFSVGYPGDFDCWGL